MARKQSPFIIMLLIISAVGLLVLGIGIVLLNNQNLKRLAVLKENTSLEATCIQYEDNTRPENMNKLRNQKAALDQQLSSLDHNLVNYKFIPTYLGQIQRAAEVTNNSLISIQPHEIKPLADSVLLQPSESVANAQGTPPATVSSSSASGNGATATSKYQAQMIGLDVRGTYASTMQLLDVLRQFPKLVYLRSLNLNPTGSAGGEGVTLHLETYAIIIPDQFQAPVEKSATPTPGGEVAQGGRVQQ